jgi:molybdate transport system ATP-binding protein
MLIVSHDLEDILKLTNHLVLIENGKISAAGNYYDLIQKAELSHLLETSAHLNVFYAVFEKTQANEGMLHFRFSNGKEKILVSNKSPQFANIRPGDKVKLCIDSDDIFISLMPLYDTSVQNQVNGVISAIIEKENYVYCLVNCGFEILIKISFTSLNKLGLKPNLNIYCMFKSASLKIIHTGS